LKIEGDPRTAPECRLNARRRRWKGEIRRRCREDDEIDVLGVTASALQRFNRRGDGEVGGFFVSGASSALVSTRFGK
jgi:hypothetical protein